LVKCTAVGRGAAWSTLARWSGAGVAFQRQDV